MQKSKQAPAYSVVNVALYVRGATDREHSMIDAQLDRLTSMVEHRRAQGENWVVRDRLVERGKSAYDTQRPGYRRLLKLARSRQIDVVAVTELNRISRNISDFVKLMEELNRNGVRLVSLREHVDLASSMGWLTKIHSFRRMAEKRRLC